MYTRMLLPVALALTLSLPVAAQEKKAKITEATARAAALARVAGTVKAHELETEGGKLIYSYDISVRGKSGIDEVHVDAMTGKVLSVVHETPAAERAEAKAESAEEKGKQSAEMKKLMARAKVSESTARATALARVAGSSFSAYELEEENGRLIYSYDLKVAGKAGVEEVHVDAITGKVISVVHEDPPKPAAKAVKKSGGA